MDELCEQAVKDITMALTPGLRMLFAATGLTAETKESDVALGDSQVLDV